MISNQILQDTIDGIKPTNSGSVQDLGTITMEPAPDTQVE